MLADALFLEGYKSTTTGKPPGGLSTNFAENVGPDEFGVVNRRTVQDDVFRDPGGPPASFELWIGFGPPFFYRPWLGNLLVDIRIFKFSPSTNNHPASPLDWTTQFTNATTSVYAPDVASTSGVTSPGGFVTLFGVMPPPNLGVTREGTNLVFRWGDLPRNTKHVLETSTNLAAGTAGWRQIGTPLRTNFSDAILLLPLDPGSPGAFYRLRYEGP